MIIFAHIPKTGGSTFQVILENTFGASHCNAFHNRRRVFTKEDLAFARKVFPRLRSVSGSNLIDPFELAAPDPFYITFTREPVARVFSHYQHMVRRGCRAPFEEILRTDEELQNLNVKTLTGGKTDLDRAKSFLEKCDFVGFTEKFDLSLRILEKLSPYKLNLNYWKKQIAPDNVVKKKLQADARAVEMTREFNRLDLELYSFALTEIFPRMCAKAGVNPDEKVESFAVMRDNIRLQFRISGFYNKVFRQVYKVRSLVT
ncbi:MAG TPA: sulfotransferase family 2 domain-containing protein [Verrucomicrobiae bacterium]|nr:sulfotransferase family 2 domain-containing protein [Verrucomicrobiae bacterium]